MVKSRSIQNVSRNSALKHRLMDSNVKMFICELYFLKYLGIGSSIVYLVVFKFSQTLIVIMASVLKECIHLRDVRSHWECSYIHLAFVHIGREERGRRHVI